MRRKGPMLLALGLLPLTIGTARADAPVLQLPRAQTAGIVGGSKVGLPADRLLVSKVPGSVTNNEVVHVTVDGTGTPLAASVDQHLELRGTGDYVIRERGPARGVTAIGDSPLPVLQRGTVVWQGFSPGSRSLAASLRLDPVLEVARLPLDMRMSFTPDAGGATVPVEDGHVPGAGTVKLTLRNLSGIVLDLPTGIGVPAAMAPVLDTLRALSSRPGFRLPTAGNGLPSTVAATSGGAPRAERIAAPLRVVGQVTVGTHKQAPFSWLLTGDDTYSLHVTEPSTIAAEVNAEPCLDGVALTPPSGYSTWAEWAQHLPALAQAMAATAALTHSAAQAASIDDVVPYLSANLHGSQHTIFRYRLAGAPAAPVAAVARPLTPRIGPLILAVLAAFLVLLGLDQLRRRL